MRLVLCQRLFRSIVRSGLQAKWLSRAVKLKPIADIPCQFFLALGVGELQGSFRIGGGGGEVMCLGIGDRPRVQGRGVLAFAQAPDGACRRANRNASPPLRSDLSGDAANRTASLAQVV